MKTLSDANSKLFHFSLLKQQKPSDHAVLENLLAQGADPNTIVNGKPIVLNFWENGKNDLFQRVLPLCDFSIRFGGRSLLGYATIGVLINLDTPNSSNAMTFENYIRLFVSFVKSGANPLESCRTNIVALNTPCVDLLFDTLRTCGGDKGDLLVELLQHNISPQMGYWQKLGIDLDQHDLSDKLPLCFNRWWKDMQSIRQNDRIFTAIDQTPLEQSVPKQRKI